MPKEIQNELGEHFIHVYQLKPIAKGWAVSQLQFQEREKQED
jgi:hypothetical protein